MGVLADVWLIRTDKNTGIFQYGTTGGIINFSNS